MAFEKPLFIQSFTCASDMSASSQQYILVKLDSSGQAHPCTAVTDKPIGVLQNQPALGELAEVMVMGITKLRAGATDLAVEAVLGVDTTSRGAALTAGTGASTTSYVVGRVIHVDASDNDGALVTALINCVNLNRCL